MTDRQAEDARRLVPEATPHVATSGYGDPDPLCRHCGLPLSLWAEQPGCQRWKLTGSAA